MALAAAAVGPGALGASGAEHPYLRPHFERCLVARRLSGPVTIDGEADAAWREVPEVSGFYADREKKIVSPATHVRVAYDGSQVHFLFRCEEAAGYRYAIGARGAESRSAWKDDCIEVFIDPGWSRTGFYQFIVTAGGAWGQNHNDRPWKGSWRAAAEVSEGGWTAEVAVPFASLGVKVKDGSVWGVNFTRNRPAAKQHSTFSAILRGRKAAERFQQIVFAGRRSASDGEALARRTVARAKEACDDLERTRRLACGPPAGDMPGEIALSPGASIDVGGASYRVAGLANHANRRPLRPFVYESYDRPEWKRLRDGYDYDEYAARGEGEFETLMRLRDWVNRKIVYSRRPDASSMDLFDLLDGALKQGKKYYCWHQSQIFSQLAGSLGLNCKVIGLPGHVTNEAWVDEYGKWVWMDSTHNVHFESGSVPLSVVEMRREWWKNRFADVKLLQGLSRTEVYHAEKTGDLEGRRRNYKSYFYRSSKPAAQRFKYAWIYTVFANNFFAQKREHSPALRYLLRDDVVEAKMRAEDGAAFRSALAKFGPGAVSDAEVSAKDFEWTLNTVTVHLAPSDAKGRLVARLETFTPNFERFVVEMDGKAASVEGTDLEWRLHPGRNTLSARAVNRFGRSGRTSSIVLESR